MNRGAVSKRSLDEVLISALCVGGFFIILGLVIALTPDIIQKGNAFVKDLTNATYPFGTGTAILPAPANPAAQVGFFTSVMYFFLGVGVLQIVLLVLRLSIKSPIRRISSTVGSLIFWLGGAVVANVFLLAGTLTGWFQFWIGLIFLIGFSLIVRSIIHFASRPSHSSERR